MPNNGAIAVLFNISNSSSLHNVVYYKIGLLLC